MAVILPFCPITHLIFSSALVILLLISSCVFFISVIFHLCLFVIYFLVFVKHILFLPILCFHSFTRLLAHFTTIMVNYFGVDYLSVLHLVILLGLLLVKLCFFVQHRSSRIPYTTFENQ